VEEGCQAETVGMTSEARAMPVPRQNPPMHLNPIDMIMKPSWRLRPKAKKVKKTPKTPSVIPMSAESEEEIEGPRKGSKQQNESDRESESLALVNECDWQCCSPSRILAAEKGKWKDMFIILSCEFPT